MTVTYEGAITFDDDNALQAGLAAAKAQLASTPDSLLSMDDFVLLGLHITISHETNGNPEQIAQANRLIEQLVAKAYSGYIDVRTRDGDEERFHAKEIAPISVDTIQEKMGLGGEPLAL